MIFFRILGNFSVFFGLKQYILTCIFIYVARQQCLYYYYYYYCYYYCCFLFLLSLLL